MHSLTTLINVDSDHKIFCGYIPSLELLKQLQNVFIVGLQADVDSYTLNSHLKFETFDRCYHPALKTAYLKMCHEAHRSISELVASGFVGGYVSFCPHLLQSAYGIKVSDIFHDSSRKQVVEEFEVIDADKVSRMSYAA
jgi:hypothetical protein